MTRVAVTSASTGVTSGQGYHGTELSLAWEGILYMELTCLASVNIVFVVIELPCVLQPWTQRRGPRLTPPPLGSEAGNLNQ